MNNQQPMQFQFKLCKYCRQRIDPRASVCPYCRKKQTGGGCLFSIVITTWLVLTIVVGGIILGVFLNSNIAASDNSRIISEANRYNESDYKASCRAVTYEEFVRDKNYFKGQKVKFTGRITEIGNSGVYKMNVTKTDFGYDDTVAFEVESNRLESNILNNDIVTIWGVSKGAKTQNFWGKEIITPQIYAVYVKNDGQAKGLF